MNKEFFYNLSIFIGICILIYFIFRNIGVKEGLETTSKSTTSTTTTSESNNGVAGNAEAYAANIKAEAIKLQDELLISKYRTDYENVIINMDDLVNNLMLKTALSIDKTRPHGALMGLSNLGQAKTALNSVMKFIDKS